MKRITIRTMIERDGRWFGGQEKLLTFVYFDGRPTRISPALARFNRRFPQYVIPWDAKARDMTSCASPTSSTSASPA